MDSPKSPEIIEDLLPLDERQQLQMGVLLHTMSLMMRAKGTDISDFSPGVLRDSILDMPAQALTSIPDTAIAKLPLAVRREIVHPNRMHHTPSAMSVSDYQEIKRREAVKGLDRAERTADRFAAVSSLGLTKLLGL